MNTKDEVLAVLARVAETDEVVRDPELLLYEMGVLDSLRSVELMLALSERFGIPISPAEMDREEWATPARIVSFVSRRLLNEESPSDGGLPGRAAGGGDAHSW
jgi:D-alanine--poly(phosphoribitol) ligase subunit 2